MSDRATDKLEENSSFIFELAKKHLPADDVPEQAQPMGTIEYILWIVGITAGLFILRAIYFILFP